jgi:hypothetical protein
MKCLRKNLIQKRYEGEQRRCHYRLVYPITERPKLILLLSQEEEYEIIDLSEDGVRFFYHPPRSFLLHQVYHAKILFHEDETEEIEGKIFRIGKDTITLFLSRKIPYKRIVKEELHLKKKVEPI